MDTSKFAELGLNEQICAGVEALGFSDPTPVQAEAIPLVLAGRDVVASAQTGTGKTAAFALPVLQVIAPYSRAARAAVNAESANATTANSGVTSTRGAGTSASGEGGTRSAGVFEDAIPQEPHLSESISDAGSAAYASSDAGSEAGASGDVGGTKAVPKRPRRHHHKKAAALSGETTSNKADLSDSGESPDAIHDSTSDGNDGVAPKKKARKRHAKKPKVVAVDRDVLMRGKQLVAEAGEFKGLASDDGADEGPDAGVGTRDPQKAGGSSGGSSSGELDASKEAKVAGDKTEKPKRKRRKKHAKKKKGGLAAEIAAAKDPNAHPFGPFALVVTPTRELAQQIDNVVSTVCEKTGQRAVIVMGGAKFERQIRELQKGCDMLVATPGRLIDLMDHNHVDLSQVKVLVLDEADRMLDMGFWPSVRRIVGALPKDRQTLLFSATIPPSIKGTVDAMLHNPAKVEIARIGETADTVEEHLCPVTQGQKIELLEALINCFDPERVLVFCRTKHRVDDVSAYLAKSGLSVDVMHSDRSQKDRERALAKFRAGKCKVLVATDVMSRGIDVSGIDAVVNFDVPMDPEDYVHRIGRTGRAGHTGLAFTFVAPDEISPLREIEYFTKKLIPVWDLEGFEYDSTRIVPNPDRSTKRVSRTMFNGARSRGRGIGAGRYGRHY